MLTRKHHVLLSLLCAVVLGVPVLANSFEIDPDMCTDYAYMHNHGDRNAELIRALKTLDESIKTNPRNFQAHMDRGKVLRAMENYSEAVQCYSKAIELNPKSYRGYKQRAVTYISMGRYKEAALDLEKSAGLAPDDFTVTGMRADAYSRIASDCLRTKDFIGAIKYLDLACLEIEKEIARWPKSDSGRKKIGQAYLQSADAADKAKNSADAKRRYKKAKQYLEIAARGNFGPPPITAIFQTHSKILLACTLLALKEPKEVLKTVASIDLSGQKKEDQIQVLTCELHAYEQLSDKKKAAEIEKRLEDIKGH